MLNRIRTDATNSAIWRAKKLNVLESRISFTTQPIFASDTYSGLDPITITGQILAPLQIVGGSSGRHMFSIVNKQSRIASNSKGWEDIWPTPRAGVAAVEDADGAAPRALDEAEAVEGVTVVRHAAVADGLACGAESSTRVRTTSDVELPCSPAVDPALADWPPSLLWDSDAESDDDSYPNDAAVDSAPTDRPPSGPPTSIIPLDAQIYSPTSPNVPDDDGDETASCSASPALLALPAPGDDDASADELLVVEVYCFTTDAGSDIAKARRMLIDMMDAQEDQTDRVCRLVFDQDCLSHQYHLLTGGILASMEQVSLALVPYETYSLRYMGTLSTIMHTLRDNQAEIFSCFVAKYGALEAFSKHLHRIAPRPISGRWGRKTVQEIYMDRHANSIADIKKFATAFAEIVGKRGYYTAPDLTSPPVPSAAEPVAGRLKKARTVLDDTATDEAAAYSSTMGKWARRSVRALNVADPRLWILLKVSLRLSSKLDVLQFVLQKYGGKKPEQQIGSGDEELGNLAMLMYGRAERTFSAIESLLDKSQWDDIIAFADHVLPDKPEKAQVLIDLGNTIVRAVIRLLSDYDRRIMRRLASDPCRLLQFAKSDMSAACPMRAQLARQLLEQTADLHPTARALVRFFRKELQVCCSTGGTVPVRLYTLMRMIARDMTAETQEIEGIQSLIKLAVARRGQKCGLPLIDAHIANVKDLGIGTRASNYFKYSTVAARICAIVESAVEYHQPGQTLIALPGIWETPAPFSGALPDVSRAYSQQISQLALPWASSQASFLHRQCGTFPDYMLVDWFSVPGVRLDREPLSDFASASVEHFKIRFGVGMGNYVPSLLFPNMKIFIYSQ